MAGQKPSSTIFKQLMFTVCIPVVVLFLIYSYWTYHQNEVQLKQSNQEEKQRVKNEIQDLLAYFDETLLSIESNLSKRAQKLSSKLVDSSFTSTDQIESCNLNNMALSVGMDTSFEDIYIVDQKGTIVNTTFEKDLGINFFAWGPSFVRHFNMVFESGKFVEDRISIETQTGLPKKYSYQSTKDRKYVVEIGLYYKAAQKLVENLIGQIENIKKRHRDLDEAVLYFGTEKMFNYQNSPIPKSQIAIALKALHQKKSISIYTKKDYYDRLTEFCFLEMKGSSLHEGYLIKIKSNTKLFADFQIAAFWKFMIQLFLILLLLTGLIYWRSRSITRPVKQLLDTVSVIHAGNLSKRVEFKSNNEVGVLGTYFNSMLDSLEESYDTLEQKVLDRTHDLNQKKEELGHKNKEILDSINYANRLQTAILPTEAQLNLVGSDRFLLYLPKDIVAGDFYWLEQIQTKDMEEVLLFAVADCTGHGVPGAMVSIVCYNALQRSLYEDGLELPNQLLDAATNKIIQTFERSLESIKDGMDISLIQFNTQSKKMYWSGAHNPLWILPFGESEIQEIKADKQPVGMQSDPKPFTLHEFDLKEGDLVYLLTDGFADQFGGNDQETRDLGGKKFKSKKLKELIVLNRYESMDAQRSILLSELEKWQGDLEQVDDITLVGIKI